MPFAAPLFHAGCPSHGSQRWYIGMVYDNPSSFDDIIAGISEIQSAVNTWQVVRHLTANVDSRVSRWGRMSGWGGKRQACLSRSEAPINWALDTKKPVSKNWFFIWMREGDSNPSYKIPRRHAFQKYALCLKCH